MFRQLLWITIVFILLSSTFAHANIVFTSDRDGTRELYVMDEDGNNVKRLTDNHLFEMNPDCSPDGKQIAFTADVDADPKIKQHDIIIINADGSNQWNLTNHPARDGSPSWSPDGKRIAFTSNRTGRNEIHIINILSGKVEQLTKNRGVDGSANDPCWSPDGRQIIFEQHSNVQRGSIYIINVQTKIAKPLIQPKPNIRRNHPRWSPDGQSLLYHVISAEKIVADLDPNKPIFLPNLILELTFQLEIINLKDFKQPRLTIPKDWTVGFKTGWSPDSKEIVFSSKPQRLGGSPDIYRYNLVTHEIINLTNHSDYDGEPIWLNRTLSVTPAGKMTTLWSQIKQ